MILSAALYLSTYYYLPLSQTPPYRPKPPSVFLQFSFCCDLHSLNWRRILIGLLYLAVFLCIRRRLYPRVFFNFCLHLLFRFILMVSFVIVRSRLLDIIFEFNCYRRIRVFAVEFLQRLFKHRFITFYLYSNNLICTRKKCLRRLVRVLRIFITWWDLAFISNESF